MTIVRHNYYSVLTRTLTFVLVISQSISLIGQTELGIHLGDLAFVKAKPSITMEQRSLNMKMSMTGISPEFYSKVGGVAFVQTAVPQYDINSISCDVIDSMSYVIINGNKYIIPLENWMLKPIVVYANSENNAAITLYGGDEIPFKYHPAFVDNLMGLRLLQTDLLLANTTLISQSDRAKFPTFDTGREIITKREMKYIGGRNETSVNKYEATSLLAIEKIDSLLSSSNENHNTYIYTDFAEPISFTISDDSRIQFYGAPYYRFAEIGIDTVEAVKQVNSFIDSLNVRKDKFLKYINGNIFESQSYSSLLNLNKVIMGNRDLKKDAKFFFEGLHYSEVGNLRFDNYLKLLSIMADNLQQWGLQMNVDDKKIIELFQEGDPYMAPLILGYILDSQPFFASIVKNFISEPNELSDEMELDDEQFLMMKTLKWHIWKNSPFKVTENVKITSFFHDKTGRNLIRDVNPLVIDESEIACQWSALFRYVKEKNSDNWKLFVEKVSSLNDEMLDNMPFIWTPIHFDNSKYLLQSIYGNHYNAF